MNLIEELELTSSKSMYGGVQYTEVYNWAGATVCVHMHVPQLITRPPCMVRTMF